MYILPQCYLFSRRLIDIFERALEDSPANIAVLMAFPQQNLWLLSMLVVNSSQFC